MLQKLQNHLSENFSFLNGMKLILAVSGGKDSMVLLHLFQKLNYEFVVAHCNFQLRGVESFEDQMFIQKYSDEHNIQLFVNQFDTENFAHDHQLSTQMAARMLRYDWFNELIISKNYDYLLTAHHADDNLETFLINLTRGTGLQGLTGIPVQNETVIRPLLLFSSAEIENYIQENNIQWREDSSNESDKYLRNKIRHHLVPLLKEMNPNFLTAFQKTQSYLQEAQSLVENATNMVYQQIATEYDDEIHFNVDLLIKWPNYKAYLYQWLNVYGFSAWDDIYNLIEAQSGKQVFSNDFRILKNRNFLILKPLNSESKEEMFFIEQNQKEVNIPLKLSFYKVNECTNTENTIIFADENKLRYPLTVRRWKQGDFFQPFGMNGKSKKVSKFFKDEKFSLIDKENTWLLCSDNQIVWIVGIRQDERFKVDASTQNIVQITLL
ncbi:MAG TPA: tRNA lysidine(34) synthetase TilS [Flavobacterium sp.]|nr:tRNA lysidine(34) synthetase TilS [Flavobacterium sp.]